VSPVAALPLFAVSLLVTLLAARLFARRLDHLGVRFGLPEASIGLLTALAADGPEISSALFALAKGAHEASVGVLVGSNAFNFAAMLGVSGLLAGRVLCARAALALEGSLGAAITLLAAAVLLGWLGAAEAAGASACLVVPYLWIVFGGLERVARRNASGNLATFAEALATRPRRERLAHSGNPTQHLLALIIVDVALIVAGSAGMVQAALALGDDWNVSSAALGVLVLAPLTSVPNAITGVRLGIAGRSDALVGETFNSNAINLGAGVVAPALFTTLAALALTAKLELAWLVAMTAVTIGLLAPREGMRRQGAVLLIALYVGFLALHLSAP